MDACRTIMHTAPWMHAAPWKSGPSGPRKPFRISDDFKPLWQRFVAQAFFRSQFNPREPVLSAVEGNLLLAFFAVSQAGASSRKKGPLVTKSAPELLPHTGKALLSIKPLTAKAHRRRRAGS